MKSYLKKLKQKPSKKRKVSSNSKVDKIVNEQMKIRFLLKEK